MDGQTTFGERVSDYIAHFGGSWWFIFGGLGAILVWVLINSLVVFEVISFDPYPYILLNLFLSLIAAFQAPFILMSQRRVEVRQDLIYRTLLRETKELVETDLALEQEIMRSNIALQEKIASLTTGIENFQKLISEQ